MVNLFLNINIEVIFVEKIYEDSKTDKLVQPWETEKFDNLYNRDNRFFGIAIKGMLNWLTRNIVMYNKPIKHFIFNTGSSYMYVESNGYEYSMNETTGEDQIYMSMPRCVVELGSIEVPTEEMSSPYARGSYERVVGNEVKGYNAELQRMPIDMNLTLHYTLSNFNESIILIQELLDKIGFQVYFNIVYLGQVINCSLEIPESFTIQLNKIDMSTPDDHAKHIDIDLKMCTSYPKINGDTEIDTSNVIRKLNSKVSLYTERDVTNVTDVENKIYE